MNLQALDAQGVEFDDTHFFFAGYDPPFRLRDRHNEVWVVAPDSGSITTRTSEE